jgi:hypothetical protein
VNDELERMWKEAVMGKFMILSRQLPVMKILSKDNLSTFAPGTAEHQAEC